MDDAFEISYSMTDLCVQPKIEIFKYQRPLTEFIECEFCYCTIFSQEDPHSCCETYRHPDRSTRYLADINRKYVWKLIQSKRMDYYTNTSKKVRRNSL